MRLKLILLCALLWVMPQDSRAGAWLREQGTTFVSTSFTINYFRDSGSTTYVEHGWRENTTVGIDVGYFTNRFGATSGFATAFLRRPLGPNEGDNKWAYELGAGAAWVGELVVPTVKGGVSWGRGIKLGEKYGWMAVDASVLIDLAYGAPLTKVDSTIGLNLNDQFKSILQVYYTRFDGENITTVAPSLVYTPAKRKFSVQVGAESGLGYWDDTAIKIGLWRTF